AERDRGVAPDIVHKAGRRHRVGPEAGEQRLDAAHQARGRRSDVGAGRVRKAAGRVGRLAAPRLGVLALAALVVDAEGAADLDAEVVSDAVRLREVEGDRLRHVVLYVAVGAVDLHP